MDITQLPVEVRLEVLEELVSVLARGLLQIEYSKDLCRHGTEKVCKLLANDGDLVAAIVALAEDNDGFDPLLGRLGIAPAQPGEDS